MFELNVSYEEWCFYYILYLFNVFENVVGRKMWKLIINLIENIFFNELNKKGGIKCFIFYCVLEGYYLDIEDDNEKVYIKECFYMKGKVLLIIWIIFMILSFMNLWV